MTDTHVRARPDGSPGPAGPRADRAGGGRGPVGVVGRWLQHPLASYYLVLGAAGLLLSLGLVMVQSASSVYSYRAHGSGYYVFLRQLVWVVGALPIAWLAARTPPRRVRVLGYPLLVLSVALLVLTYVPGIGVVVNGNRNWIDIGGPFRLQPSEFAKLALVVWGADIYARKGRLLREWKHLIVPYLVGAGLVVALVVGQGDLGTAVVLMAMVLTMLWVVGVPGWLFGAALGVVGLVGAFFVSQEAYRLARVTGFLDPFADFEGTGWQGAHSIYAFASGGWWGTGLGASRQKWGTLPEAHTDFIFAVIGEELGLLGSLVVVALFAVLGYAIVRIAWRATSPFIRYAAAGLAGWLLPQALINMGAVLGVLPVTGIPLPFVSYGGSALLPTVVAVGLLVAFALEEPGARAALATRRWRPPRLARRASGSARRARPGRGRPGRTRSARLRGSDGTRGGRR